ncbi:hypothetical protein [Lysobacter silvisoli]|uniref:Uncharacterized protein n=1 Tax=Lysobacter silvisoli TaxID=2293254 RepID=A0A371JYP7_9GAMM|nr:hypothetical protein [Lysobacter silvisoli]RDZ26785.1 hypothetical protein DX914_17605 [Lysobacter silvisoli]
MKRLLPCLLLLWTLGPAWADEPVQAGGAQDDGRDRLQVVLEQQRAIRADLDDGGIDGLSPRQASAIRKAQKEVFAAAEGKQRLDQLSMDDKIRLDNALERIQAELGDSRTARDGQDVCWRERVSGTSMKKTRCGTEAQRREAREGARDYLERPRTCGRNCGGL